MPRGVSPYTTGRTPASRYVNLGARVQMELEGDWVKGAKFLSGLSQKVRDGVYRAEVRFGNEYHKKLLSVIQNGGSELNWPAHSANYVYYKRSMAKAGKISHGEGEFWRFTGKAYRHIEIMKDPKAVTVQVGISRKTGDMNLQRKMTVSQYITIVEHGSFRRGIAARPLFLPVFNRLLKGKEKLRQYMIEEVGKKVFRDLGFNIS